MSKKSLLVTGAEGRMGQELVSLLESHEFFRLGATVDTKGKHPRSLADVKAKGLAAVVDFTLPEFFNGLVDWCVKQNLPLVSGTTGLSKDQLARIKKAGKEIPILWSPNMSLGVAFVSDLLSRFRALKGQYDFQIEEHHHRHKKDKPSGTALLLQKSLESAVGSVPSPVSVRGGGIFGIHRVFAMGEEETITIEHTALNRRLFARGALTAAEWLVEKKPGQYSLQDVINDR